MRPSLICSISDNRSLTRTATTAPHVAATINERPRPSTAYSINNPALAAPATTLISSGNVDAYHRRIPQQMAAEVSPRTRKELKPAETMAIDRRDGSLQR